jgi:hypothetical protein
LIETTPGVVWTALVVAMCHGMGTKANHAGWSLHHTAVPSPQRNCGLLHVCTRSSQQKAQKENGLVCGLEDPRYLSVTNKGRKDASGWTTDGSRAVTTQW